MRAFRVLALAVMIVCLGGAVPAQDVDPPLANWGAAPYWTPQVPGAQGEPGTGMFARDQGMQAHALAPPPTPLPFVAVPPCRIVDTRAAIDDGFHRPNFADDESRTFPVPSSPDCPGLPSTAGAWSLNIQFRPISQLSFLTAFPTGITMPGVSTMTAGPAAWVQNAAIVPAGTGGAIDIYCQYAGRVIIDINGYYGPGSVVTSLNALTGDVTLAEGSNIGIAALGNTLTINATGGPGGDLPTGTINQTLRNDGKIWVASSLLTNDGVSTVGVNGALLLPNTTSSSNGVIVFGTTPFIHKYAGPIAAGFNTFVGRDAGNFTMGGAEAYYGSYNTAVGTESLHANTTGAGNTSSGYWSLRYNTTGGTNTAIGQYSLRSNNAGYSNTAIGARSLYSNETGFYNVAAGYGSLGTNSSGFYNTGYGAESLSLNSTGSYNIAVGQDAGSELTTGDHNIDIGNIGLGGEANTIRIGDFNQTRTFIAGIYGVALASQGTRFVTIDEYGQLGTQQITLGLGQDAVPNDLSAALLGELHTLRAQLEAKDARIAVLESRQATLQSRIETLEGALAGRDRALERRLAALEGGKR